MELRMLFIALLLISYIIFFCTETTIFLKLNEISKG